MKTHYQDIHISGFTFWKGTLGCTVSNERFCSFFLGGGVVQNVGREIIRARLLTGTRSGAGLETEETGEKV